MPHTAQELLPTLIRLASAVPGQSWSQQDLYEQIFRPWYRRLPDAEAIFQRSGVERRGLYLDPFEAMSMPRMPTGDRMRLWKQGALELSRRSMTEALAGFDTRSLGSLVMVSCTGYDTPSPDQLLAAELGLSPTLRRTFVGHMGCFAAFNGLKVALDALAARPDEAALVVCTARRGNGPRITLCHGCIAGLRRRWCRQCGRQLHRDREPGTGGPQWQWIRGCLRACLRRDRLVSDDFRLAIDGTSGLQPHADAHRDKWRNQSRRSGLPLTGPARRRDLRLCDVLAGKLPTQRFGGRL